MATDQQTTVTVGTEEQPNQPSVATRDAETEVSLALVARLGRHPRFQIKELPARPLALKQGN
jgi:hypothetical protein